MQDIESLKWAAKALSVMDIVLYRLGVGLGESDAAPEIIQRRLYEVFLEADVGNQLSEVSAVLRGVVREHIDCDKFDREIDAEASRLCERLGI